MNAQGTGINSQNKFKWQVYNISEQRWSTLSSTSSSVQWQPNKGSYLINCELLNSYEILLLDCQKYLNGNPKPWVYGTGLKKVSSGRHLWTTYAPNENGYYWTYYRLYNESGQLIDDHCYGAFLTK